MFTLFGALGLFDRVVLIEVAIERSFESFFDATRTEEVLHALELGFDFGGDAGSELESFFRGGADALADDGIGIGCADLFSRSIKSSVAPFDTPSRESGSGVSKVAWHLLICRAGSLVAEYQKWRGTF